MCVKKVFKKVCLSQIRELFDDYCFYICFSKLSFTYFSLLRILFRFFREKITRFWSTPLINKLLELKVRNKGINLIISIRTSLHHLWCFPVKNKITQNVHHLNYRGKMLKGFQLQVCRRQNFGPLIFRRTYSIPSRSS